MKNIVFVVGSLREGSFNKQAAKKAQEMLAGKATVSYLDLSEFPHMNQDLEVPTPEVIQKAREQVLAADGLWIFSPVYNYSIPGVLKNGLDWLSRALDLSETRGPSALNEKAVTVTSFGDGTEHLFKIMNDLLPFIRMNIVSPFVGDNINPEAWGTGELVISEETLNKMQKQAEDLLA